MAATHFFRLSDLDFLFDPQYIRGFISHRYELPVGAVTIAPLLRPPATRNILSPDGDIANFERTLLETAPRRRWRGPARAATGLGHVTGQRDRFGRQYGGRKRTSRFTEPEVV